MPFNPTNTRWVVFELDNSLIVTPPPIQNPWEFDSHTMKAFSGQWTGTWNPIPGKDAVRCHIKGTNPVDGTKIDDAFEVNFVTDTRFIATKNGLLYRFGKKFGTE
jgi:hypothetical protein